MKTNSFNKKSISANLFWRFGERILAQGVSFIVSIILARVLIPEHYGIVAIVTILITIFQVFIDGGLTSAIIQKKNADRIDYSTVFFTSIFLCILFYLVLFISAPFISSFFNYNELTIVIRVLGITLIISSVKGILTSYISKNLQFKKFFLATLFGTITSAAIGIYMAYAGFGVWALVAQSLINNFIDTVILWIVVKWRPSFVFSMQRLKVLFSYGYKIFLATLIDTIYNDLRQVAVGKVYSAEDLAFYNKGKSFPVLLMSNVNSSIDSVLFPAMSNVQNNEIALKRITKQAIKNGSFILFPCLMGLFAVADTFVDVLLTEKWAFCVPFIRVFCLMYMFYPLFYPNLNLLKAMGKSKRYLILEIIRKIIGLIIIILTIFVSPFAVAVGALIATALSFVINLWSTKRLINYGIGQQIIDILPNLIISIIMCFVVYLARYLAFNSVSILLIQVSLGIFIYFGLAYIFKNDSLVFIRDHIKTFFKRFKN